MADLSVFGKIQSVKDLQRQKEELMMKQQLMRAQVNLANKQASYVDLDKVGEMAFIKASRGEQLTPEEMAGLNYLDSKQQSYTFNPVSGAMERKPSLLDRAGMNKPQMGGGLPQRGEVPPVVTPVSAPQASGVPMMPNATPKTIQKMQELSIEEQAKREQNYTKAQSALQGFNQQAKLVTDNIDKALATISKPGSLATGYGQVFSRLPDTDARQLNNYLDTIKANVGFDKLQQMRENSPTGGALGQVSDTENRLLQAVNGALDPLQGDQLAENLQVIKQLYPVVMQERQRAFEQDYGMIRPFGNNPQPPRTAQPVDIQRTPQGGNNLKAKYGLE